MTIGKLEFQAHWFPKISLRGFAIYWRGRPSFFGANVERGTLTVALGSKRWKF